MYKHRQQVYSGLLVKMNTGIKLNSKQGRQEIKVWKRGTTLENVKIKVMFFLILMYIHRQQGYSRALVYMNKGNNL